MTTISLRLPKNYHERLRELSSMEGISINQLITLAVGEKLSAIDTEGFILERAERANRSKFDSVLKKVKDTNPDEMDKL